MGAPPEIPDRVRQLAAGHQLGGLLRASVNQKRSNWAYPGAGSPAQALYLYQSGLVMVRGKQTEAARWDDAERYWWQSTESPTDSADDIFCTIRRRDGVELTFEGYEKLAEEIGKAIARAYLPAMLAHLGTGGYVPFGPVSASRQGISGAEPQIGQVPWDVIEGITVDRRIPNRVKIAVAGRPGFWQEDDIRRYPAAALAGLAEHMICERLKQRVPGLVAEYRAGRALTFGPLSLSLRGLAVSGGRILPWQEIRYLWVHQDERLVKIKLQGRRFFWQKIPTWQVGDVMALHDLLFCLNLRIIARIGRDRTPTIVLAGTSWPLRPVEDIYRVGAWAERAEPDYLWYLNRVRHDEAAAGWSS